VSRRPTIEEDFRAWLAQNAHVYREIVVMARRWRERHPDRQVGIAVLWETLRWRSAMEAEGGEYKLDNRYRSYMAREVMEREADLAGIFETRQLRAPVPLAGAPEHAFEPQTGQGVLA